MMTPENLRFHLRAFEETDSCRLAWLVHELTSEDQSRVGREEVVKYWAEQYPAHVTQRRKTIRNRMSMALVYLRVVGMVCVDAEAIIVTNREYLRMAAENLILVQDDDDQAVSPVGWIRRPQAPEYLQALQAELEVGRQAAIEKASKQV